jgi:hypothetical protein
LLPQSWQLPPVPATLGAMLHGVQPPLVVAPYPWLQ